MSTDTDRLVFRAMTEQDIVSVMEIEKRAHLSPWTEGIFSDCTRVGYVCLLGMLDNRLVCYGVMSIAAGECHIFNVCVNQEQQNRGFGRAILQQMLKIAQNRNAESCFLEVRPSNKNALKLYLNSGFDQIGVRENYYPAENGREDALILAKTLNLDHSF